MNDQNKSNEEAKLIQQLQSLPQSSPPGRVLDDSSLVFDPTEGHSGASVLAGAAYFVPRLTVPANQVTLREEYLLRMTSTHITNTEKERLLRLPVPLEVGQIQLTVERHNTGLNRFWPHYTMAVSGVQCYANKQKKKPHNADVEVLKTVAVKASQTSHHRLEMGDEYVGRLRGGPGNRSFYLFDAGAGSGDAKPGAAPRRHFGTVVYDLDHHSEAGRRISVFLPMVDAGKVEELCSWPDSEQKKANVSFEYAQQLLSTSQLLTEGKQETPKGAE